MRRGVDSALIQKLHSQTSKIRNVCVLAHVDHGKTSLTDSLIVSNGIISQRLAGKIRYMDSRPDEQQRLITMKSSSISLLYQDYLINIIDSPGHVDFSSEVSTAVRITDGAIIVVDVVEGLCVQTEAVLRQAWMERLTPVLVLNKVDRLVTELKNDPSEAYAQLRKVLEQVNAISSTLWVDLEEDLFNPCNHNVVFGSAVHGWAFGLSFFADVYAAKLGMNPEALMKVLWGDYFYDVKKKKVFTSNPKGNRLQMFIKFCLKPIWDTYEACVSRDAERMSRMAAVRGITIAPRELRSKDLSVLIQALMGRWMPLSSAVLGMCVLKTPNPIVAQQIRMEKLWKNLSEEAAADSEISKQHQVIADALCKCDPNGPLVVFVSKVFPDAASEQFIAFCRIFSGTLRAGDTALLLSARYDPINPSQHVKQVTLDQIYMLMGASLEPIDHIAAGNVFGLGGIASDILKTATITDNRACTTFTVMPSNSHPIIRVALEPQNPYDMEKLARGLELLYQADPAVEIDISSTGEHVLIACGELHLELCVKDLKERYAKIDIDVSDPIVPFREGISDSAGRNGVFKSGVEAWTADRSVMIRLTAVPLPQPVVEMMEEGITGKTLQDALTQAGKKWSRLAPKVWSVAECNILVNRASEEIPADLHDGIQSGFKMAATAGPLCEEPMMGLCFIIEQFSTNDELLGMESEYGPLSGQIIPCMKDGCRSAFLTKQARIYEAMYRVDVRVPEKAFGAASTALGRRQATIFHQDFDTSNARILVSAYMPVSESFGFYAEILGATSGSASVQTTLSRWKMLDEDPFYVPTTVEELEDVGDGAILQDNRARLLLDNARRRKGLVVERKLVKDVDKQRTMSKKK